MPDSELFYDENPARYVQRHWEGALAWWETIRDGVQESYDMANGYDQFMKDKEDLGYSGLTIPLIYVITEARIAALWEMLSRQEPFFRFEPQNPHSDLERIAAERKESAMQNMRQDLQWDAQIIDLFNACEWSNHAWWNLELEELQIGPQSNVVVGPDMLGTHKAYNTFNILSPGQVLVDGFQQKEGLLKSKFKLAFMPYWMLKESFPSRVGAWLTKHAKSKDDSAYYNPNLKRETGGREQDSYARFDGSGASANDDANDRGFLVAEAHIHATFKDGSSRQMIYTFLPEVRSGPKVVDGSSKYGYRLSDDAIGVPFPYENVSDLIGLARGRRMPYTMQGKSTAELTLPLQREFSDQIATERDLDRQYLQPNMAVRGELLAGEEQPSWGAGEVWTFKETDWTRQMSIRDMAMPLNVMTPNRGYLAASREKLQSLAELIGAAVEATTGAQTGSDEKVGIFQARARGGAGRINLVFQEHARTMLRIGGSILAIMSEAPGEFLSPHIRAYSETLGMPGVLGRRDIITPSKMGIPALQEYANREFAKIMWMTVAEVVSNMHESPEVRTLLLEDILRSQTRDETRVQQYVGAASQFMQQQQITAAMEAAAVNAASQPGDEPAQQSAMLSRAQGSNFAPVGA